jgi:anti-sigma factor ChrR (cupin superfamily)
MTAKRPVEPQAPGPTDETAALALASRDLAAPAPEPPPGLWAKIDQAMGLLEAAAKGVAVARFGEGRWRQIGPGVQMKRLWDKRTVLLRCEPGARVPDHEHPSC